MINVFRGTCTIGYCFQDRYVRLSIDTYSIRQYVKRNSYSRLLAEEKIIENANQYPLSTAIGYKKHQSRPIAGNNRPPVGKKSYRLYLDLEPIVGVIHSSTIQRSYSNTFSSTGVLRAHHLEISPVNTCGFRA